MDIRPVLYRIFFPFLLLFIIAFVYAFRQFLKRKTGVRRKKNEIPSGKRRRLEAVFASIICVLCFFYMLYLSCDLVFHDFRTSEGVFLKFHRSRYELLVWDVNFEIDGATDCFTLMNSVVNVHDLIPGCTYEITYAKRTNMVLSITPPQSQVE